MKKDVTVAVSGYFDPIHVGHLEYLKLANLQIWLSKIQRKKYK